MQKGGWGSTFFRQRKLQIGKNPCLNRMLENNIFSDQTSLSLREIKGEF
ncbi:hypothetical protein LEP1GSC125_0289 [Leptospira mayottensis 200901122]|uniref:Uncharacterized protein n=1 Tax=Leptospira mayottensis 200901122 TaxID=1193010 RepID=A0AA87MQQ9_9LEPT|nr:hypothetical protein LEP1GSC125_0289 [Leptospira mayottensis 200901122]